MALSHPRSGLAGIESPGDAVDSALEILSFSYLDGVPFRMDPKITRALDSANRHQAAIDKLLSRPLPILDPKEDLDPSEIGRLEKQVLEQLERIDREHEERMRQRTMVLEEYRKKSAKKEEEKEEDKVTASTKVPEDSSKPPIEDEASTPSSIEDRSAASTLPAVSPIPSSSPPERAPLPPPPPPAEPINFSDFEGESDPFERAELETLNDLQELADVLRTTTMATTTTSVHSSLPVAPPLRPPVEFAPVYRPDSYVAVPAPIPYVPPYIPPVPVRTPVSNVVSKEHSPPTSLSVTSQRISNSSTTLDAWVSWPNLDDDLQRQRSSHTVPSDVILAGLSPESRATCIRIGDMGFPLERVARVFRSLGSDESRIVHCCLLVDKFVASCGEGEKPLRSPSSTDVERVVLMHKGDEAAVKKHLTAYEKLADLGFDSDTIHEALSASEYDPHRALERLLK